MSISDYCQLAESKIQLGCVSLVRPCKREKVLHAALALLPYASPRELRGYARAMQACADLTALE